MSLEVGRRLPICFATYRRGERVCDGGGSEEPCVFRDRCLAMKMACEDAALDPGAFILAGQVVSPKAEGLVVDALFKYEIRNGIPNRRFQRVSNVPLANPPSELFARRRESLERLVRLYFRRIAKLGGVELAARKTLAEPRSLYIDDFEATHGYTTLGFKIMGTNCRKVTRIWKRKYRPKTLVVDVALTRAQLEKGLPNRIWKRLRFANPKKGSAYPARIANLNYAIAEPLAKLLGKYIQRGFFSTGKRPKDFR